MGLGLKLPSQVFKTTWSSYKSGDRYTNKDLIADLAGTVMVGLLYYSKLSLRIES